MTSKNEETLALFVGRWIGETQGYEMPAHIWEIARQGDYLRLMTRWEGETKTAHFYAEIVSGEPAFKIHGSKNIFKATLIDKQHFVIPGWCTNDARNGQGPSYDVIFSRPGIAELTAREVYLKSLQPKTD